jgi:hypothetical protein
MKDCKCGKIPPCYSGKKFRIHEELEKIKAWDDTHDKVYELNRQMCDIVRRAEENIRLHNDNNKYARLVRAAYESKFGKPKEKDIMEEKKTRIMTKAEAFGYLTYKKVACYNGNEVDIQKKLFEIGFKWCDGTTVEVVGLFDFLLIDDGTFQFTDNVSHFRKHAYEEISADDILSIEILEDKNNEFVDCSEPCPEIKAVQELLRNSKHLKDKIIVITKDNAAIL